MIDSVRAASRTVFLAVLSLALFPLDSLATPPPAQALAKLNKNDVKPFEASVRKICGPRVKVTVKLDAPPDANTRDYPVKDVGAFLSRAANSGDLTRNSLDMVTEALKATTSDALGKQALAEGLKEVVVYAAVGGGFLTFEDGVLTVGSHIFGDGEGSSIPASSIEKILVWGLGVDGPHVGHRIALQHRRAIENIEAREVTPFREKVKAIAGPSVKVTVRYDPPADAGARFYAVKDPGPYLVRAGLTERQLTIMTLNLILEALNAVAIDDSGKAALRAELKEIVVLAAVGEAELSLKGGVLTVGSHIFGDGQGSSNSASDIEKALSSGLLVSDPNDPSGTQVPVGQVQAMQKIETRHLAPFRAKAAALLGPTVMVTAKYSTAPGETAPVKDPAKYLARLATSTDLTINMLDQVLAAVKEQAGERQQVKSIVVYVVVGDSVATLSGGVLTVGGHVGSDGNGSSLSQSQVAKALSAKH
jgi:hypothetical protein